MAEDSEDEYAGIDEEEEEAEVDFDYGKEQVVFLVDACETMLLPCMEQEAGKKGKSFIKFALQMIAREMKGKIFSNPSDEYAVVFYGTKSSKNDSNLIATYLHLGLGPSDASRIQQVGKGIPADVFEREIGSLSLADAVKNEALRMGLWVSSSLLNNKTKSRKTIYVLTNNDSPCGPSWEPGSNDPVRVRAEELKNARVTLQLLPLPPLHKLFDIKKGWLEILVANRGGGEEEEEEEKEGEGEGEEVQEATLDQEGGFFELSSRSQLVEDFAYLQDMADEQGDQGSESRLGSVEMLVRKRLHRKRAVSRTKWRLTAGTTISVHLFNLVQTKQQPATAHYHAVTNKELRSERKLIDSRTGAVLDLKESTSKEAATDTPGAGASSLTASNGIRLVQFFQADERKSGDRFPTPLLIEKELLVKIKSVIEPGLSLLGFKPQSLLKTSHQIAQSSFLRPSDKEIKGSVTAFKALLDAMVRMEVMAICSFRRTKMSDARLVALLPQREVKDTFGVQLFPEGLHLIPLPFVDDIRRPEVTEFRGKGIEVHHATEAMIAAAGAVVEKLSFPKDANGQRLFPIADVPNPFLQRHLQVIEAKAMGLEIPELDPIEDDLTLRDESYMRQSSDLILMMRDLCYGENANADGDKGKKRKANAEAIRAGAEESYMSFDWPALAARQGADGLEGLTLDKLKIYLLYSHLPVSGKKADVCERIRAHIRNKMA